MRPRPNFVKTKMLTKHQNQKEIQPYHAQSLQLMGLSLQLNAFYLTRFCRQRQKRAFQALRPLHKINVSSHSNYTKNLVKISLDSAITGINPHYLFNFWPTLKKKRATNRRHTFLIRIMLAQTNFFCNPVNHQSHKSHIHQIFWPSRPPNQILIPIPHGPNYSANQIIPRKYFAKKCKFFLQSFVVK